MASPSKFAILFLVLFLVDHVSVSLFVHGEGDVLRQNKNVVKTIKTEDGDVVDCVDMEKQPALDHPLLKGHQIQMKPSSLPERIETQEDRSGRAKLELKSVNCPPGTVPILRTDITTGRNGSTVPILMTDITTERDRPFNFRGYGFRFGSFRGERGDYTGISGWLNVWNPKVEMNDEASGAYVWVQTGRSGDKHLNVAGAGWTVNPTVFGDHNTRFAILWTRDNFFRTGCWNLICPGFVQISPHMYLGGVINPLSTYNDPHLQYHIALQIVQDSATKNWWLMFQDEAFGYWPSSIFTGLSAGAESLSWGGKIMRSRNKGSASKPEMGSGHLPEEGYSRACYVENLGLVDGSLVKSEPKSVTFMTTSSGLYDVRAGTSQEAQGLTLYFGGR